MQVKSGTYRLERTDALIPYANNARTHSADQIAKIARSIQAFGFTSPVLVGADRGIIAGHGRVLAARHLGIETVPVVELAHLSAEERQAYILADNRLALDAGWDDALLRQELGALDFAGFDLTLTGFNADELAALRFEAAEGLTDPDEAPEAPAEPVTAPGDVWIMGRHRLMCGDTTDRATVAMALAGEDIDIVVTSPPYNQKIDGFKPSGMHKDHGWVRKVGKLAYADNMPERDYQDQQRHMLALWASLMRDGAAVFYNHKPRYRDKRVVSPMEWLPGPFSLRQEIIWRRPGSVTQNARMFLPCDERIYWMFKGDNFTFNSTTEIKTWSSVWDIAPKANLSHAVAFPVELPERAIRAASKADDLVFDAYMGSGTTLIASEKTGRRAAGVEISPAYCDVAVLRWQAFTGHVATHEATGRSFADLSAERVKGNASAPEVAA